MILQLSPGPRGDYKYAKEAIADWEANKDFVNETQLFTGGGTYINKEQAVEAGYTIANIYFKNKTKHTTVQIKGA